MTNATRTTAPTPPSPKPSVPPTFAGVPGPCGPSGYRVIRWASAGDAARLADEVARLVQHGPVTANPHHTHDGLRLAVTNPAVVALLTTLLGPALAVENSFLIAKLPGVDFPVPAHQDGVNHRLVLDPGRAVAVWFALTPADVANGGLEVVPGSHREGYLSFGRSEAPGNPLGTLDVGDRSFTPLRIGAGQACLMDVRLLHRSGPNRTTASRVGFNVRYVAPGAVQHRAGPAPQLFCVAGTWPATSAHHPTRRSST